MTSYESAVDELLPIRTIEFAEARQDAVLFLRFDDGVSGTVDVRSVIKGARFAKLLEPDFFAEVVVDEELGTVVWPGGLDLSPEVLRTELVPEAEFADEVVSFASRQAALDFFGRIRSSQLHYGDNLPVLRERIPDESVDLVYLDPPFNSKKTYNAMFRTLEGDIPQESRQAFQDFWVWDARSERAFSDLLKRGGPTARAIGALRELLGDGDLMAYLTMMAPRLVELRRVLKPTGSIYLHCDQTASHYLKILMDAVFGSENFLNNIVWLYGLGGSSKRYWPRKHDDILWYSRSAGNQYFEADKIPAKSNKLRGQSKKAPDYWDIPAINNMAKERLGYPTQKPLQLLERIVRSSSPEGGVVLDPFCGCGTTIEAAERLERTWIGVDVSYLAIEIAERRLLNSFGSRAESRYRLFGQPQTMADAAELYEQRRLDFEFWAVGLANGDPLLGEDSSFEGTVSFPMPDGLENGRAVIKVGQNMADLRMAEKAVVDGTVELGVVVPLHPDKGLVRAAAKLGTWDWPVNGRSFPRLQVVSVEEMLTGAKPVLPTSLHRFPFEQAL